MRIGCCGTPVRIKFMFIREFWTCIPAVKKRVSVELWTSIRS